MNTDKDIRAAIAALTEQERQLSEEVQALGARLTRVRNALAALVAIDSEEPAVFSGKLADACRNVLKSHRGSLSPKEVRDRVRVLGYELSAHDNEMAAIHGVLKALEKSGEAKSKTWTKQPGVTRYYWADESVWTSKP